VLDRDPGRESRKGHPDRGKRQGARLPTAAQAAAELSATAAVVVVVVVISVIVVGVLGHDLGHPRNVL
jgi:hypothetical protein